MKKSVLILAIPLLIVGVWFFIKYRFIDVFVNYGNTTISKAEAGMIAKAHHDNMKGLVSDDSNMIASLAGLTADDLKMIFNSFGLKSYVLGGRLFGLGKSLNLIQWYDKEIEKKVQRVAMYWMWEKTGLPFVNLLKERN